MKKEDGFLAGFIIIVVLITFKIWIKFTFELQLACLVLLVAASWTLKYFIFKKLKSKKKGA
ncbi:hypothetical protein [Paenilisteria rocourtiae]|uniref:Uncharacterized protein n=1 Tax=Listeria rocourtiae TaxID=647910 RepID=A0A4R6ZP60_9LIST|nr:hypothetical protein [Listeria rocourtiae]EUJ51770.1 hypothetical protein PROCOU_01317 [Listeria rocourtiae FSL F6-920]MBC1434279.1 hypothetical protein [Listeria rocourtiae]MBC1603802.1 hypothetical protein [Listeria rocourtiae]TDR54162.1 hypothetical protein DFP96_103262 [Listeria rocourtiae]